MSRDAVILGRARTPIGKFQGALSSLAAPRLGAVAIKAALQRANVNHDEVDEVIMGEVITAGVGQAPARQASIYAGIPTSVPCTTVNKVCGSGLKAVMMARQSIQLGESDIVVAGGMESMSNAPYLLPTARAGMRLGDQKVVDSLVHDGLWDPYGDAHMVTYGNQCAAKYEFSREQQDAYAKESYERAIRAQKEGHFDEEITPVAIESRKSTITIDKDEEPGLYRPEKMGSLRPVFDKNGTITAGNSSKIDDGAAALVIASEQAAQKRGAKPLAKIVATATFAQEPDWFTTAPAFAIKKALHSAGLSPSDIDIYEINEAFSVVAMAVMKELGITHDIVNIYGGAVALGHPIGCSGARILTTLLSGMIHRDVKRGCASLCLGGGEAVALIVER